MLSKSIFEAKMAIVIQFMMQLLGILRVGSLELKQMFPSKEI